MLKILVLGISLTAAASPMAFSWTTLTSKTIESGVVLTQLTQANPPLLVNVITVDRSLNHSVQIEAQVANGSLSNNTGDIRKGRENVSSLAIRTNALAVVNGDYFPYTGDPLGLGISHGEIYSEPYTVVPIPGTGSGSSVAGRAAFGVLGSGRMIIGIPSLTAKLVMDNGTVVPISGIDRLTSTTDPSDAVICAPIFGPYSGSRGGGTEIVLTSDRAVGLSPGKSIAVTIRSVVIDNVAPAQIPPNGFVVSLPSGSTLASGLAGIGEGSHGRVVISLTDVSHSPLHSPTGSWNNVANAIGGGPILLQDGNVVIDSDTEGIASDIADGLHSRTGVGITSSGKLLIVTVDSGSIISGGLSLADFAQLFQKLGAKDAMNFDGGGSTTMVVNGQTVDYPSGSSYERPVADMMAVYDRTNLAAAPMTGVDDPTISPVPQSAGIGDTVKLIVHTSTGEISGDNPSILWNGPVGNVGFVTQDGIFHIFGNGQGTISARYLGQLLKYKVTIGIPAPNPTPASAPSSDNNSVNQTQMPQPQAPMNRN